MKEAMDLLNRLFGMWSLKGVPVELRAECHTLVEKCRESYARAGEALKIGDFISYGSESHTLLELSYGAITMNERIEEAKSA